MISTRIFKMLVCRECYFNRGRRKTILPQDVGCGFVGVPEIDFEAEDCLTKQKFHGREDMVRG